jgi:hypothetical protein
VNYYSSLFRASTFSTEFASKQHRDFSFVLESLKQKLEMMQRESHPLGEKSQPSASNLAT